MIQKLVFSRWLALVCVVFAAACAFAPVALALAVNSGLRASDGLGTVTDVIVGHNSRGPYTLTWTGFSLDGITAVINGRFLRRGADYNIDPVKGIISFNATLTNDSIVSVTYRTVPNKSQRASGGVNLPVALDLFRGQGGGMKLTGLYAQDDPKNPNAYKTIVGLGGDRKWTGGKIDSMLLLSQHNDSNNGSLWDRAAMKFGGETNVGGVKLTGSFLHAGDDFGGAKEYGVGLGKRLMDLGAFYSLGNAFQASAKFLSSADSAGATSGTYSRASEQKVAYKPTESTKISMARTVTENGTAVAGSNKSLNSDVLAVTQGIGAKTTAVATLENARTTTGAVEDSVRTRQLALTSSALDHVSLRTLISQKHSELYGDERGFVFGVAANPTAQVNVDMAVGTLANEQVGNQTSTDVKVTASPIQQVAVQASYSGTDSSKLGQTSKTNVGVKLNPVGNVQLQTNVVGSTQNDNQQIQRDFGLSSNVAKYAKVTAQMSQKVANTWDDVTKGAALELTPLARTRLSAGYKSIETGSRLTTIRDYSAESKLWSVFNFNGSLRDRTANEDMAPDTSALQVALSPFKLFSVTGDYQYNPEDQTGAVQKYKSTAVGLNTHFGSLGVTTNYTAKDEYQLAKLSDERKLGVELPLFSRHGQITSGYKIARLLDGSQSVCRTYSLGLRHAIGSDFSLSLTGNYVQFLQNQAIQPDKTEYSAEGSLGLKF